MARVGTLCLSSECRHVVEHTVTAGPAAPDDDFGRLEGVVYNAAGEPARDAEVRILGLGLLSAVDQEGRFVFESVLAGSRVLEAVSPRWGQSTQSFRLRPGETLDLTVDVLLRVDLDVVTVTAGPLGITRSTAIRPADAISHQALLDAGSASLGETLSGLVGIHGSYFSPGSSRPIIRGAEGYRVALLLDGHGVMDASAPRSHHAPAVESLLADKIEVIRGTGTLLYGSSSIGGVVNVLEGRIPAEKPTRPIGGSVTGQFNSVSSGITGAGKFRGAFGNVAWALHGMVRESGDFRVPKGSIMAVDHGHDDPGDHGAKAEHARRIEHSSVSLNSGSFGLSYLGSWGHIGASVSRHYTNYGVPGHDHSAHGSRGDDHSDNGDHGDHDDDRGDEVKGTGIRLDMLRVAYNVEGVLRRPSDFLRSVRVQLGITDYAHDEMENNVAGLTWAVNGFEGRIELDHALGEGFHGVAGLQTDASDTRAVGDEAFLPPSQTTRYGLFLMERYDRGRLGLEGGLRFDRAKLEPESGTSRSFSGLSTSLGANFEAFESANVAVSVARSVRFPDATELYSDGHHVAGGTYEQGDQNLDVETALSMDASLFVKLGRVGASATVFSNRYSGFMFLSHTDEVMHGLQVLRVRQDDAHFRGFEVDVKATVFATDKQNVGVRLWSDYTRAERASTGEPLPRIPPMRAGGELYLERGGLSLKVRVTRVQAQRRVEEHETTTDGFGYVDATAHYRFFALGTVHAITLSGRNLSNAVRRAHASVTKSTVPLPGRDFRLTYRVHF